MKKYLIAGDWKHEMYEYAWAIALKHYNIQVIKYSWISSYKNLVTRAQVKYSLPFILLLKVNLLLLYKIKKEKPDVVIIWIGTQIFPITLSLLKKSNIKVVSYVHDDPFSHTVNINLKSFYKYYWKFYLKGIKHYDLNLYSKEMNVLDSYNYHSKNSQVFRQYYVPEFHKKIHLDKNELLKFKCEVAFAGHYENDGRLEMIKYIVDKGVSFNLYGDESWNFEDFTKWPSNFKKLNRVSGYEYTKALNGANICLCFMSKLNRDQYTTRCFEIPSCGSILLAERTEELSKLFVEGEHAFYFESKEELLAQVKMILNDSKLRKKIKEKSKQRLNENGDDIYSKIKNLISKIDNL